MKISSAVFGILVAAVVCLTPIVSGVAQAKGKSADMGKIALVIHNDGIDVSYHRAKAGRWGLALGGLVGAIVSAASSSADEPTRKDAALKQELNDALGGWNFNDVFRESLTDKIPFEASRVIISSKDWPFKRVEREFYVHGNSRYEREDPVYDYTPLISEGVDTVVDIFLDGSLAGSGKVRPYLAAQATYIDLKTKTALARKFASIRAGGKDANKEFSKFVADGGAHARKHFSELAPLTAAKLARKLK